MPDDVLSDPILRFAYDDHGHSGVRFLRRAMNSTDSDLVQTLSDLHRSGQTDAARDTLNEAIQLHEFETHNTSLQTTGAINLRCSMLHTNFLGMGEGPEPVGIPELEKASVSFSAGAPADGSKWGMTIGGQSSVKNGEGQASGQVSVGYSPVEGTDMNFDVDLGEDFKFTVGSSRLLSTRTFMATSISTIPKSDQLALSVSSYRGLFRNSVHGFWAVGVGSDFSLHYGILTLTTVPKDPSVPKCTAKLNLGAESFPLKLSAEHKFSPKHSGRASYGWGSSGFELMLMSTRALSGYSSFSIGVRHGTDRGLSWLLRIRRGDISFSVPILVSSVNSPGYSFKVVYLSLLSHLIDESIGELIEEGRQELMGEKEDSASEKKAALQKEESLMEQNKARRDAQQQAQLMEMPASKKRETEKERRGLVIVRGTYSAEGGETLDVTTQLQFWVVDSKLRLPSTSKSNMLGFYDVRRNKSLSGVSIASTAVGWKSIVERFWPGLIELPAQKEGPLPNLKVRYSFQGGTYEVSIADDEELALPSAEALRLGGSDLVS